MDPIGNISGLISGIDFRELVNQIIAIESRPVTAANRQVTENEARLATLKEYRSLLTALSDTAKKFTDGTAFKAVSSTVSSPGTANTTPLVGATPSLGASPGTYQVEVLQLAQTNKVGSIEFASTSDALGMSGEFLINGRRIEMSTSDSLLDLRDRINDANSGTDATRVTASILSVGANAHRLVLTTSESGAAGIDLVDGADGLLRTLGYLDTTTSLKHATSGGADSDRFTSATESIASLLGLGGGYGPTDVTIAGQTVSIDLSTQSLTDIATSLSAITGVTASVESDDDGSYIAIQGTTSFVDAGQTLELLGITKAGRASVNHQLTGGVLTDGDGVTPATGATLLANLFNGGSSSGVQVGDTFTISGTQGDGALVERTFTVGAGDTVQTLLDFINDASVGFGSGSRPATASISAAGELVLTDDHGGDSQLSLSLVANNEGGGRLDLGAFATTQLGRDREIVAGRDSRFRIDGVTISRSTNAVSDVVPDMTLYLNRAAAGEVATVTIERHFGDALSTAEKLVESYNKVIDFIKVQTTFDTEAEKQPLFVGDSALRGTQTQLAQSVIATVTGVAGDFANSSMAGISLTRDGHLQLDSAALETAFAERYNDLVALYSEQGTATSSDLRFVTSGKTAEAGSYDVEITTAASQATVLGAGFSGTYADDGVSDTLTITDRSSGGVASIALMNGATTAEIVDALNTEFSTKKAHKIETNSQLFSDAGGTTPITADTTFNSLYSAGGVLANATAGDTISLIGTRHGGASFETTFTISDPATTTVGDLVDKLQQDFGSGATVTVQNGRITVEAGSTGASTMALVLNANNEGGGSLDFGGTDIVVRGRQVLGIEAFAEGNDVRITHSAYGAAHGFDLAFTAGGTDGTGQLGMGAGSYDGVDVVGTIGGHAATGTGRALVGGEGTPIDGLHIEFLGSVTGSAGQIQLTVGVGALLERTMDRILDIESGGLMVKEASLTTRNERLVDRVARLEDRLELRRQQILQQFFRMEELVSRFQSQQQMLTSFITNSIG